MPPAVSEVRAFADSLGMAAREEAVVRGIAAGILALADRMTALLPHDMDRDRITSLSIAMALKAFEAA